MEIKPDLLEALSFKEEDFFFIEWDLKNNKGIPIASGVYLIHIDAEGLGERVIKWFGVNRKFDPSGL